MKEGPDMSAPARTPLAELPDFRREVSLIPDSGIQFLDFGFRLTREHAGPWGFFDDPRTAWNDDAMPEPIRPGEEDGSCVSYTLGAKEVIAFAAGTWLPLPLWREEAGGGYFRGPVNWARAHLVRLAQPDPAGNDFRVVVAVDTALEDFLENEAYLAPSAEDARNGRTFSLPGPLDPIDWFLRAPWVKDWCVETYRDMVMREEQARAPHRTPRRPGDEDLAGRMGGPHEHLALYRAFLDLLKGLELFPQLKMVDRASEPRLAAIDVDLVIDLGNSRTCGLLIEVEPDHLGADITKAVKLQLRDLGQPAQVYADPFDSRLEFARAQFGRDHLSRRSGRQKAFSWPTIVRVGPEASRLAALRMGSEGDSGLSSAKRYLWDDDPRPMGWRLNAQTGHGEVAPFATEVDFTTLVNDRGEALHRLPDHLAANDERWLPAFRALYSRQSLMSFALSEILLQALTMINAPAYRLKRRNADLPRRLRRVIMTMPTAMPLAERQIYQAQAETACELIYLCLGLAELDYAGRRPTLVPVPGHQLPTVILKWDEATATQAVYLYTEVAINHSGDARAFFDAVRAPVNARNPACRDSLRVATIDIGGGTTDLVVTTIRVDGKGANVTLFPSQDFREGFTLAGDDITLRVVREHVVEPIRHALVGCGCPPERAEVLLTRLIGGNRGDMGVAEEVRRQQFATQVAQPVALALLGEYERIAATDWPGAALRADFTRVCADSAATRQVVAFFNAEIRRAGIEGFDLAALTFATAPADIDRTVRSVATEMMQALAEVTWRLSADVLLLSGRPSRLPALRDILVESCALAPHRIVALHQFRVGQWYPFRGLTATIGDPKTTASVGAMLCLLGEGQLHNFNFRSDDLRPRSSARCFGKLDMGNRLRRDDVYYDDLDLDSEDYALPDTPFEFRGPMALGFRQLAADWWPGTRLYTIDYASAEHARQLNGRTPLLVSLRRDVRRLRARKDEGQAVPFDRFSIARIEDRDGNLVNAAALRLRLQTIDSQSGYWLDTGVLIDR